jgi:hypothetical protein
MPDIAYFAEVVEDNALLKFDNREVLATIKGVSKEWKSYISAVYKLIVGENDLGIAVCSPVRDERDRVIGILCGVQTTDYFKKLSMRSAWSFLMSFILPSS